MSADHRVSELGLRLPASLNVPPGVSIPFQWVRVWGDRAFVSGHGALDPDGNPAPPFGRVPTEVSLDEAQASARAATLAVLAGLRGALGSLDSIRAWLVVHAFVNAEPGYAQTTAVVNPASDLILDVFGDEVGAHARTAIGVAALPLNLPVILTAEVAIAP